MTDMSIPPLEPVPVDAKSRRWSTGVICFGVGMQAVGLLSGIFFLLLGITWELEWSDTALSSEATEVIVITALLAPMALFNVIALVGVWFNQQGAWMRAMLSQGILLAYCLVRYINGSATNLTYFTMLSCLTLVLYLNSVEVRLAITGRTSMTGRTRGK
jgi:hypothetical protein